MRRIVRTPRRLISLVAALGLTTGLLAALAPLGAANATGGPGTAFPMPANSVAHFSGAQINGQAADSLSWGYQLGVADPVTVADNGPGYTEINTDPFDVGAGASPTTLRVFLTDNTCAAQTDSAATYWSDLTPYDHVNITGTTVYQMYFMDAGGPPDCSAQNSDRTDGAVDNYNFKVTLTFDGLPLQVTKTADVSSVEPNGTVGYTITVTNPNVADATISSISDTLPAGFTYQPGTTTGVVTSDPPPSETLTWDTTDQIVPGNSSVSLSFQATASGTDGDYFNNAYGTSPDLPVTPSGDTAEVTVMPPSCPTPGTVVPSAPVNVQAYPGDTSAVVSWDPPDTGSPDSYTVNVFDDGAPGGAPVRIHADGIQTTDTTLEVTGLNNGDNYHFTVQATNCAGTGPESDASNEVMPTADNSATVIGDGNLTQSTGTTTTPNPGDSTLGSQTFPAGSSGIGSIQEFNQDGSPAARVRGTDQISEFCLANQCLGNIIEAKLVNGVLGPNPKGGLPYYKLQIFLDRSLVRHLGTHVHIFYDGDLSDDGPGDPTPAVELSPCSGPFNGTPCIFRIVRTHSYDLKIMVKSSDLDPRLITSK